MLSATELRLSVTGLSKDSLRAIADHLADPYPRDRSAQKGPILVRIGFDTLPSPWYPDPSFCVLRPTSSKELPCALIKLGAIPDEVESMKVQVDGAYLTYDYQFCHGAFDSSQFNEACDSMRLLQPKLSDVMEFGERKLDFQYRGCDVNFRAPSGQTSKRLHSLWDWREAQIRLWLPPRFLRQQGIASYNSWLDTDLRFLRDRIFEETMGKAFRLREYLRDEVPDEVMRASLAPDERDMLDVYFSGNVSSMRPTATESPTATATVTAVKRNSRMVRSILLKVGVDIRIPWCDHQAMHHERLKDMLLHIPFFAF